MMTTVKVYEERAVAYVWSCLKCFKTNESLSQPEGATVRCVYCGEEYEYSEEMEVVYRYE